jgi:hypothetical protein
MRLPCTFDENAPSSTIPAPALLTLPFPEMTLPMPAPVPPMMMRPLASMPL